jgi:hypothetical protein
MKSCLETSFGNYPASFTHPRLERLEQDNPDDTGNSNQAEV